MASTLYTFYADLVKEAQVPENGILSRTLHNDERVKVILFGFAPGQELSAHTAPMPAAIQIVSGKCRLKLGEDWQEAGPGAFAYMTPKLEHAIQAQEPTVMLLFMLKNPA